MHLKETRISRVVVNEKLYVVSNAFYCPVLVIANLNCNAQMILSTVLIHVGCEVEDNWKKLIQFSVIRFPVEDDDADSAHSDFLKVLAQNSPRRLQRRVVVQSAFWIENCVELVDALIFSLVPFDWKIIEDLDVANGFVVDKQILLHHKRGVVVEVELVQIQTLLHQLHLLSDYSIFDDLLVILLGNYLAIVNVIDGFENLFLLLLHLHVATIAVEVVADSLLLHHQEVDFSLILLKNVFVVIGDVNVVNDKKH